MDELDYNVRFRMMQDYSLQTATLRYTHARPRHSHPATRLVHARTRAPAARASTGARVFPRYRARCFRAAHAAPREKYGAKKLPEDHAVVDWGITWDEIEPYYTRADKLVGASGKAGNLAAK